MVLVDLLPSLKADAAIPPARFGAKRLLKSESLLTDEVVVGPLDRIEANLFIRFVSAKHVRDWLEDFDGDEILTTAILDRLLHHVHTGHIDGRSVPHRELDKLVRAPPAATINPREVMPQRTRPIRVRSSG